MVLQVKGAELEDGNLDVTAFGTGPASGGEPHSNETSSRGIFSRAASCCGDLGTGSGGDGESVRRTGTEENVVTNRV